MKVLVVGGSGSGKSAFAERLCSDLSPTRTYLATMAPYGIEALRRIERHRRQRVDLDFSTIECIGTLAHKAPSASASQGVALLDDVGNLVANALFAPDGSMADPRNVRQRLLRELDTLGTQYRHVVVVGNEVGSEGPYADGPTQTWVRLTGSLCCALAANSDTVVEVVAGIPQIVKGALP